MELIARVKALIRRTESEEDIISLYEIEINNVRHSCCVSGVQIPLMWEKEV